MSKKQKTSAVPTKRELVEDSDDEDDEEEDEDEEDDEDETEDVLSSSSLEATNNILNATSMAPHLPVRNSNASSSSAGPTTVARRNSTTATGRRTKSSKDVVGVGGEGKSSQPLGTKKTKGRVKIQMAFIDNKLRRYTTFSKRKAGLMKKAFELSTLTGTEVLLLVASETGHVYTFATTKLQPMIVSEAGKALIQTCLNSPDNGGPVGGVGNGVSATISGLSPSPPTRSGPSTTTAVNITNNTANMYRPTPIDHFNQQQQAHLLQQQPQQHQNGISVGGIPLYYNSSYADAASNHNGAVATSSFSPITQSLTLLSNNGASSSSTASGADHLRNGAQSSSPGSNQFYPPNTNGDYKQLSANNNKTGAENSNKQQRRESTSCSPASSSLSSDPLSYITPTLQLPPPPPRTPTTANSTAAIPASPNTQSNATSLPPINASLLFTPSTPRSAATTVLANTARASNKQQQQHTVATSYAPTMATSVILDPLNCSTSMYSPIVNNHHLHANPYQHVDMYGNVQHHLHYPHQQSMNSFFDFANDDLLSFVSPSLGLGSLTATQQQQQHNMSTPLLSAATTGAAVAAGCNPFLANSSNSHENHQQHFQPQQLGTNANGGGNSSLNAAGMIQLPAYAVLSQQAGLSSSQRGGGNSALLQQHNNSNNSNGSQRESKDEMLSNFLLQ